MEAYLFAFDTFSCSSVANPCFSSQQQVPANHVPETSLYIQDYPSWEFCRERESEGTTLANGGPAAPFRCAFLDRCLSILRFKTALQDCPSGLSFRIAFQDWPSRLSFGIGVQRCLSGLPFRIAFSNLFWKVAKGFRVGI